MNGPEILRIVDAIHRDKNIDKEIVFEGIEQAILSAARKHFGEDYELEVAIDRENGEVSIGCNGEDLSSEVIGDILGRVAAQTAKQVMIQKIREAERDALFDEFEQLKGLMVSGSIVRFEGGSAIVNVGKLEAILPRSEQIPGESHRTNERIRAVVLDVRKTGSRVKVILSRTHADLVLELFKSEIPEVNDRVIEVRSLAREAGYRSKVAVSCIDTKIDPVGACVGVRGARIRNIVDELGGERIDIVRWNESLPVLVPNAMQPAEVEDVILCPMLGRVIVLVRDDQLSLAIGKRGQNVRLASKLVGWDIEVMTQNELDEQLEKSVMGFSVIPDVSEELAESLVSQGFFSFYDLSVIEPDELAELGGLTAEQCDAIVEYADREAERLEKEDDARRALEREQRQAQAAAEAAGLILPSTAAAGESATEESAAAAEEGQPDDDGAAAGESTGESAASEASEETSEAGEAAPGEGEETAEAAEATSETAATDDGESSIEETAEADGEEPQTESDSDSEDQTVAASTEDTEAAVTESD